jgi:DNA helicase II / ATP-dependent DNA helicase PcrA
MREETGEEITVKTFHAFCSDVLKQHGSKIGIDESFEILLPDDAKILIHRELKIKPYWANRYMSTIATAKDFGISLQDIQNYITKYPEFSAEEVAKAKEYLQMFYTVEKPDKVFKKQCQGLLEQFEEYSRFAEFVRVWQGYDELKKQKGYLDYADLTDFTLQLLNQFNITFDYKHICVDEFQDTNKLQFSLIEKIADHKQITVVGDPNQSIYGFRGSYKESFAEFMALFNATQFTLDEGYRCTDAIYTISHDLIQNNFADVSECFKTKNANGIAGESVKVVSLVNAQEEARFIADTVEAEIAKGVKPEKICVLYRSHKQARILKNAIELKKIPVISAGRTNIFRTPEIKTAISYLGILNNLVERTGTGEQSWWHLFHFQNTLSTVDSITIGRTIKLINKRDLPLEEKKGIDEILLIVKPRLSEHGQNIVSRVVNKLTELRKLTNKTLPELILDVYELSGLNRAFSHERTVSNIEALLNLKKFHDLAEQFSEKQTDSVADFIEYIEIVDELGVSIDASQIAHVDAVRMMTIHASKGLEFDTVIVSNMATDRFPLSRTQNEPLIPKELLPDFKIRLTEWKDAGLTDKDIEKKIKEYDKETLLIEERRLCYVAWTRAKHNLILTFAQDYKNQADSASASQFLEEITYQENKSVEVLIDSDEKSTIFAPASKKDVELALLKKHIITSLDSENIETVTERVREYISAKNDESKPKITFNSVEFTFSPTALIEYMECPKRFELSKIYQMPGRSDFVSDGSGTEMGSYLHKVAEVAMKRGLRTYEEFEVVLQELHKDFPSVAIADAKPLLKILVERNSNYHNPICEMALPLDLDGYRFYGLADRVDVYDDGVVITDYKTNKDAIPSEKRALQLGFYALALQSKGYVVKSLVMDMLKLDKPIIMDVEGDTVVARVGCNKLSNFSLSELRAKIVGLCDSIKNDYENGFLVAQDENACRFCQYKFYCPKWEGR